MSRFIAIITRGERVGVITEQAPEIVANWRQVWRKDGIWLWCEDAASITEVGPGRVIIGAAFSRETGCQFDAADEPAETDLDAWADRYWGHYVALSWDQTIQSLCVHRAPLGALATYVLQLDDAIILASEPRLLFSLASERPRVDWQAVGRHFAYAGLRGRSTCLERVTEIEAGTQHHLSLGGASVRLAWSPWDHVDPSDRTPDQLAGDLHHIVNKCVAAWASVCGPVGLTVSGGLDSSIIAACLQTAGADFAMLTMATDDPDGDERDYARLLALHLQAPLHEHHYSLADVDVRHAHDWQLARPSGTHFLQAIEQHCAALARDESRLAFFNGSGGDNVFCFMRSATAVTDRYLAHGLNDGLRQTIMDICDLTGATVATVVHQAALKGMSRKPPFTWRTDRRLLSADFLFDMEDMATHWWLTPPKHSLPGKAVHIGYILRALSYNDGLMVPGVRHVISPLLSQPIVEFCLSVPTWIWVGGGRDRSLARKAFSSDLPEQIIDRRSKGGPDSFSAAIFERWRSFWRELLLDGQLARAGVIDRKEVERVLSADHIDTVSDHQRLMSLAAAEIWGASWSP